MCQKRACDNNALVTNLPSLPSTTFQPVIFSSRWQNMKRPYHVHYFLFLWTGDCWEASALQNEHLKPRLARAHSRHFTMQHTHAAFSAHCKTLTSISFNRKWGDAIFMLQPGASSTSLTSDSRKQLTLSPVKQVDRLAFDRFLSQAVWWEKWSQQHKFDHRLSFIRAS